MHGTALHGTVHLSVSICICIVCTWPRRAMERHNTSRVCRHRRLPRLPRLPLSALPQQLSPSLTLTLTLARPVNGIPPSHDAAKRPVATLILPRRAQTCQLQTKAPKHQSTSSSSSLAHHSLCANLRPCAANNPPSSYILPSSTPRRPAPAPAPSSQPPCPGRRVRARAAPPQPSS